MYECLSLTMNFVSVSVKDPLNVHNITNHLGPSPSPSSVFANASAVPAAAAAAAPAAKMPSPCPLTQGRVL